MVSSLEELGRPSIVNNETSMNFPVKTSNLGKYKDIEYNIC